MSDAPKTPDSEITPTVPWEVVRKQHMVGLVLAALHALTTSLLGMPLAKSLMLYSFVAMVIMVATYITQMFSGLFDHVQTPEDFPVEFTKVSEWKKSNQVLSVIMVLLLLQLATMFIAKHHGPNTEDKEPTQTVMASDSTPEPTPIPTPEVDEAELRRLAFEAECEAAKEEADKANFAATADGRAALAQFNLVNGALLDVRDPNFSIPLTVTFAFGETSHSPLEVKCNDELLTVETLNDPYQAQAVWPESGNRLPLTWKALAAAVLHSVPKTSEDDLYTLWILSKLSGHRARRELLELFSALLANPAARAQLQQWSYEVAKSASPLINPAILAVGRTRLEAFMETGIHADLQAHTEAAKDFRPYREGPLQAWMDDGWDSETRPTPPDGAFVNDMLYCSSDDEAPCHGPSGWFTRRYMQGGDDLVIDWLHWGLLMAEITDHPRTTEWACQWDTKLRQRASSEARRQFGPDFERLCSE